MADILISASLQDREIAEKLSRLFEARGLNVDWMPLDPLEPGNRAGIVRRRANARVTIALWTKHSVTDAQVLEDAREALRRGSLLAARQDDIVPPPEFRANPTANLSGWDGSDSHIQAGRLLTETAKLLERTSTRPALALASARLNRSTRGPSGGASAALRPSAYSGASPAWPDAIASAGRPVAMSAAPDEKTAAAIAPAALQKPEANPESASAKPAETAPAPVIAAFTTEPVAAGAMEEPAVLALTLAQVRNASDVAEEKLEARPAPVLFAGEPANDALPLRAADVSVSNAAPAEPIYQTFTFEPEPQTYAALEPAPASATQNNARVITPAAADSQPQQKRAIPETAPRPRGRAAGAPDRPYFIKEARARTERDDRNHYLAILVGVVASIALLAVWFQQRPQDFAAPAAQKPVINAAAEQSAPDALPSAPFAGSPETAPPTITLEPAPASPEIAIASDLPLIEPAPVSPQTAKAAGAPSEPPPEVFEMRPARPDFANAPAAEAQSEAGASNTVKAPAKIAPPSVQAKAKATAEAPAAQKTKPAATKAKNTAQTSGPSSVKAKRLAAVGRALDARAAAPAQIIAALAGAPQSAAQTPSRGADPFDAQLSLTTLRFAQTGPAFHLPGLAPTMLGAWTPGPDAPAPLLNAPISDADWNAAQTRMLAQSALAAGSYRDHLRNAQAGERRAMLTLGLMRQTGIGEAQDDARAFAWLRRAALAGEPRALAEIGAYYAAGKGVARDDARAVRNFDRSAMWGAAAGKNAIGWALASGRGLPLDDAKARVAFEEAAQAGDPLAALNLGRMQADGRGGATDIAAAKASYGKAADQGFAPAQYALSVLLLLDLPAMQDDATAAARAQVETLAALRVQQAAAQGYPPAQSLLGALYLNGIGVAQDNSMARAWLARAPRS